MKFVFVCEGTFKAVLWRPYLLCCTSSLFKLIKASDLRSCTENKGRKVVIYELTEKLTHIRYICRHWHVSALPPPAVHSRISGLYNKITNYLRRWRCTGTWGNKALGGIQSDRGVVWRSACVGSDCLCDCLSCDLWLATAFVWVKQVQCISNYFINSYNHFYRSRLFRRLF